MNKAAPPATNGDREAVLFIIRDLRARLKRSPGLAPDLPLSDAGLRVIEEALAVSERGALQIAAQPADIIGVLSNCDAKRDHNYRLGADSFTITNREYAMLCSALSAIGQTVPKVGERVIVALDSGHLEEGTVVDIGIWVKHDGDNSAREYSPGKVSLG